MVLVEQEEGMITAMTMIIAGSSLVRNVVLVEREEGMITAMTLIIARSSLVRNEKLGES